MIAEYNFSSHFGARLRKEVPVQDARSVFERQFYTELTLDMVWLRVATEPRPLYAYMCDMAPIPYTRANDRKNLFFVRTENVYVDNSETQKA